MTHLCSVRVTHAKNTICPRAREEATPKACVVIYHHPRRRRVTRSVPGTDRLSRRPGRCRGAGGLGLHLTCRWQEYVVASCRRDQIGVRNGSLLASRLWSFLASAEGRSTGSKGRGIAAARAGGI